MSETRCIKVHQAGKYVGEEDCVEVSGDELAEEQEQNAIRKAEQLIDAIKSLDDAKVFLERLIERLLKNGALP